MVRLFCPLCDLGFVRLRSIALGSKFVHLYPVDNLIEQLCQDQEGEEGGRESSISDGTRIRERVRKGATRVIQSYDKSLMLAVWIMLFVFGFVCLISNYPRLGQYLLGASTGLWIGALIMMVTGR